VKNEWVKETRKIFGLIERERKPYDITINGITIVVYPNVFSPKYFTDTKWFATKVAEIVGKKTLLEVGTGCGFIALFAALNGAHVEATDINPDAVANTKENFARYDFLVPVYLGDMFETVPPNNKYDVIFWNHPFNNGDDPGETLLLKAGFDYHYDSLRKYVSQAHLHLATGGRLLLGSGIFADKKEIQAIAKEHGYELKKLEEVDIPLSTRSDLDNGYFIYELKATQ